MVTSRKAPVTGICRPVPPTDPFGLVGQVLDGQFRVDAYVGEGGFSVVYSGTSWA